MSVHAHALLLPVHEGQWAVVNLVVAFVVAHLDGGLDAVKAFLLPFATEQINEIVKSHHTMDYKTMIQQIVQQVNSVILDYCIVSETGPAHKRIFEVEARLDGNVIGRGKGFSKREAEQNAAKEGLSYFGVST